MLQVVAEDRALNTLDSYFTMLKKTGYVKHNTVSRFLAYLFFIDFLEYTHDFFNQCDYDIVSDALGRLFAGGNCMLPYPIFCQNGLKLGKAHYMGSFKVRVTEVNRIYRSTENDKLRGV